MAWHSDTIQWEVWGPLPLQPDVTIVAARLSDTQLCRSCRNPDLVVTMTVATLDTYPEETRAGWTTK